MNTRELLIAVYRVHRVIQASKGVSIPKWATLMQDQKHRMVEEYDTDGAVPWDNMSQKLFDNLIDELQR